MSLTSMIITEGTATYHQSGEQWWVEDSTLPRWTGAGSSQQECRDHLIAARVVHALEAERDALRQSEDLSFGCFHMIAETLTAHGYECSLKTTPPMSLNDAVHNALAAKMREVAALRDECAAIGADRDALRLRVAALEANLIDALNMVCKEGNSAYDCAVALTDVVTRGKGGGVALRSLLVEAAQAGIGDATELPDPRGRRELADAIADRIIKGGGK